MNMENNSQDQALSQSEIALRNFQDQMKQNDGNFSITIGKLF